jgi:hypothetical protein
MLPRDGTLILSLRIWRAKREIRRIARRHCRRAKVFSLGAVHINPRHLAIWITTPTDEERDLMRAMPELISEFRRSLSAAGYPPEAIAEVGFAFESQQTVDRDYDGSWWYAVK